ncbi:hypothetical protein, partial [Stenotrophomonas sp. Ste86]|uniref:hypothetical protein n=1 Tax=Stenotrophomonas sp. Ste86 TaxID=2926028 RepID=UPI00211818DB
QHLCMISTGAVPSMARHYPAAGNALTWPGPVISPSTTFHAAAASTHGPVMRRPPTQGHAHPRQAIVGEDIAPAVQHDATLLRSPINKNGALAGAVCLSG